MLFTLRRLGSDIPDWHTWTFADGELHTLTMYRVRSANLVPITALNWSCESALSLPGLHHRYRRLATALKALDPLHSAVWDFVVSLHVDFTLRTGPGMGGVVGTDELHLFHGGPMADREIAARLRRRAKDWSVASFSSHDDGFELSCGISPSNEATFVLGHPAPVSALPINALADCIESTKPRACRLEVSGDEVRRVYEPWPLSRKELMGALEQIEKEWFPPAKGADTD